LPCGPARTVSPTHSCRGSARTAPRWNAYGLCALPTQAESDPSIPRQTRPRSRSPCLVSRPRPRYSSSTIVSAVAGDSHKNSEIRRALQPLVDLGERTGCAILGISHFSKGTAGRDPVERVTGSIGLRGARPSRYGMCEDDDG